MNTFEIILTGCKASGKTSFMRKHLFDTFSEEYKPTLSVEVYPILFSTTREKIVFTCWEIGEEIGFLDNANGAIVFIDLDHTAEKYIQEIKETYGNIPIVVVRSKCENAEIDANYDISAKTGFGIDNPFLFLARTLLNDPDIEFLKKSSSNDAEDSDEDLNFEELYESAKSRICATLCDMVKYAKKIHSGPVVPFLISELMPIIRDLDE